MDALPEGWVDSWLLLMLTVMYDGKGKQNLYFRSLNDCFNAQGIFLPLHFKSFTRA